MQRRAVLAASVALAVPGAAKSQTARESARAATRVLRFIPHADLASLDPMWTTAYITRNHGFMVFDTLFGLDGRQRPSPQMLEGFSTEADGKLWRLVLREGLRFHDGEPVRARDCAASLRRWARRDGFGGALFAATDELTAADDRTLVFRLNRPFPLLPDALAKTTGFLPVMLPERLAQTDPFTQITDPVGSGPFRFLPGERVPGARVVYERFEGYKPREGGTADWTAGPKVAHFDRVEWTTIPDPATAAGALMAGEQDWWDYATADLVPMLRRARGVVVAVQDPSGQIPILRFNHLQPPFDNPGVRRALLGAVNQEDVVTAVAGTDRAMWNTGVGFFCPGTPMASDAGLEALTGPRDLDRVKRDLAAAGYRGERVVLMGATDLPVLKAMSDVTADMMQRAGLNLDYQTMDWGGVVARRPKKDPVGQGGWSAFCTAWAGLEHANPAGHLALRGNGEQAWFGWPTSPGIEALRDRWFDAPDTQAQARICADIQRRAFQDVPYIPMGQYLQPTAHRASLSGVPGGFALFWGVRRV